MNAATMYTDGRYLEQNPGWHREDSSWKARHIARLMADHRIAPARLAEVGCGAGGILRCLADTLPDAECSGFEISEAAFGLALQQTAPRIRFFKQDLLAAPAELSFDVLLAIDVIEHVEDCFGFVRGLKGRADYKIFHFPLDLSVQSLARMTPITSLRRSVGHIHYFTRETAEALLTDCGYEIVDSRYTASRLELPNQAFSSRLMALPRRLLTRLHADLAVRFLGGYSLLVLAK